MESTSPNQTASAKPASRSDLARRELARRELARRSLLFFTQVTHPRYEPDWIHKDIARRLQRFSEQVARQESPRLMLLVPPRHGKSELASIRLPAWHLGHHPTHEVIDCGYNLGLPLKWSRKVRGLLRSPMYQTIFEQTLLDPDSQGAEEWLTTKGGGFTAAGVGGGITGKGAHILIIDDPIKNMEEADSITVRDALQDWYESTAYTRLAPGGGVLIIETWWNDDDLAGRLQQAMNDPETEEFVDQFEIVKYPALAEHWEYVDKTTDAITRFEAKLKKKEAKGYDFIRKPGQALNPKRFPEDLLQKYRHNLQPRIWSALYQQNPVPDSGFYFKRDWFKTAPSFPSSHTTVCTTWDFAVSEKSQGDWTVGATCVRDPVDMMYVTNIQRFRMDMFGIIEAMMDEALRCMREKRNTYVVGVEDGPIWRTLKPMFMRRCRERKIYPRLHELHAVNDKMTRGRPLQGRMQHGRLCFLEGAPWYAQAQNEMLRFPAGAHDDVVDAISWNAILMLELGLPKEPQRKRMPSWKDKLGTFTEGSRAGGHMAS